VRGPASVHFSPARGGRTGGECLFLAGAEHSGNPGLNEPILLKHPSGDPLQIGCEEQRSCRLTGYQIRPGAIPVLKKRFGAGGLVVSWNMQN